MLKRTNHMPRVHWESKQWRNKEIEKVLGVQWNATYDDFQSDTGNVAHMMEDSEPTKGSVVGITAKFFIPCDLSLQ